VDLQAPDPERVLAGLVGAGGEAVQREGHVTGGLGHGSKDLLESGDSSVVDAEWGRLTMMLRYRAAGADLPFGDLRPWHGVAMEGHFWRITDARSGRVIVALCGVNRAPDGVWANVALAAHPGGFAREADVPLASADRHRLAVSAGPGVFTASADRLRVDLGPDAQLDVRLRGTCGWPPRRPFGGSGAAHALPGLGQYWHPHVLGGTVEGSAVLGGAVVQLDGAALYAEKNWGAGGFPRRWWWGQAQGFDAPEVCVAFAGGELALGPLALHPTALVVRLGRDVIRLGNPLVAPVHAEIGSGQWSLRGRGPTWSVEVEGAAPPGDAHILPVPLPAQRRSVPGALEHLAALLRVVVRTRGRVVFAGESLLAGLEVGGLPAAAAEAARRRVLAHPR
jgi:hypothetical protein